MDYNTYRLSRTQILKYSLCFILFFAMLGKLFYGSALAGIAGIFFVPFLLKRRAAALLEKRKEELVTQFLELIRSYSNSLKAGYSLENAFREAYNDLCFLYRQDDLIMAECRQILGKLQNNIPLGDLLSDFGKRSGVEEIRDFASVFYIARKSGGNLPAIIADTADKISSRLTVTEEIKLSLTAKRFEQNIMDLIPVIIMLYIGISNPGYFDPLYFNVAGIAVMTLALFVYVAAYFISVRIMDIRV